MPDPDEFEERLESISTSMTITEFFQKLEKCDSTRVHDFWCILEDTILEILNTKGMK